NDVQTSIALGIGVRLVAGIDDRPAPGSRRRHAFPDVLRALADAVLRPPGRVQHLAGAAYELPRDEERHQHISDLGEVADPGDAVVLVAAIGVAVAIGVVLEQVDVAGNALARQPVLGVDDQVLQDALPGPVVIDELDEIVTFGCRVLRMRAHIEVDPGSVAEKDVTAPSPGHDPAEQVARNFVRSESSRAARGARDAVLRLKSEDSAVHCPPLRTRPVLPPVQPPVRSSNPPSSSRVNSRYSPSFRFPSRTGPIPIRDRRRTGWPTASIVRRTMRFRPSCNVILIRVRSAALDTILTDVGRTSPSSRVMPCRNRCKVAGFTNPVTSATYVFGT